MPTTDADADDPSFIWLLNDAAVPSSYVANEAFLWEPRKTVVVLIAVKTMWRTRECLTLMGMCTHDDENS